MSERINRSGLQVAKVLDDFISSEALPGTGVDEDAFWAGVAGIVRELTSENRELLEKRDTLQKEIDRYQRSDERGEKRWEIRCVGVNIYCENA